MSRKSGIKSFEEFFEGFIFWSRWVQAPLYGGLVIGAFLYLVKFFQELWYVASKMFDIPELEMMLKILGLVDISMVMNLVVMVTIGGYSIFTSKIDVDMHEDKPLWLEGLDAGQLKIKLATSLASISGVQLLKTFIQFKTSRERMESGDLSNFNPSEEGLTSIIIEIVIHMVFIFSALLLAHTEKTLHSYPHGNHQDSSHDDGEGEEGH
ncbi:MAG: YqhA family protein [Bacteroidota bacterium]